MIAITFEFHSTTAELRDELLSDTVVPDICHSLRGGVDIRVARQELVSEDVYMLEFSNAFFSCLQHEVFFSTRSEEAIRVPYIEPRPDVVMQISGSIARLTSLKGGQAANSLDVDLSDLCHAVGGFHAKVLREVHSIAPTLFYDERFLRFISIPPGLRAALISGIGLDDVGRPLR